jgi:anti-sigma factor RsiW
VDYPKDESTRDEAPALPEPGAHENRDGLPPIDPDLALLESYLDGELSSAELQSLQGRLHGDPELSGALSRLSADYTVRQAVWSSLEGNNAECDRMARKVKRAVRRASLWERSKNAIRVGAAVAACLVCFVAGWVGRGSAATASPRNGTGTVATTEEPAVYEVALTDEQGNITAVQKFNRLEDAKAFAADVGKWQAEQAQQPPATGTPVMTPGPTGL